MIRFLLYIKHHFGFVWRAIEWLNGILFIMLHRRRLHKLLPGIFDEYRLGGYTARQLRESDLDALYLLIQRQSPERLTWFKPHAFDKKSLRKAYNNPAFLMMGVFRDDDLAGYFFLRFFWNRKCFVGRLIDLPFEGKGIGRLMNDIMYHTGWQMGFRVLSTVSKNNHLVMRSHANNPSLIILKELDNDFLFVEFVER